MRAVFPLLLLVLTLGCAGTPVTLHFSTAAGREVGGYVGRPTNLLTSVEVDPGFYGRGCVSVDVKQNGDVSVLIQQDGTTDWIIGRAAPGALREVAIALMGFVTKPVEILGELVGIEPTKPDAPSDIHGCGGMLED